MKGITQSDDIDNQIPNQQIALLQFFEPDNTVKQKRDVFFFQKFINDFVQQQQELLFQLSQFYPDFADKLQSLKKKYLYLDNIELIHDQYQNFVEQHFQDLISEYHQNDINNVSSLTYIKIRGCYPDLDVAKNKILDFQQQKNQPFNTYGVKVGEWQPLLPADMAEQQQYSTEQQQQVMNKFKLNQQKRDQIFSQYVQDATSNSDQQRVDELQQFKQLDDDAKKAILQQQNESGSNNQIDKKKQQLRQRYQAMGLE